ncbi:hypothetical protein [Paenibacillus campi]|uniref:hypothetical protein n=1 Tax=Paenibacillus campi TaxID=3106031 RepID=UPI002AFF17D3|nr:hypothetical protein [Paenibacillus sp. SGZ-1009]
MSIRYRCSVALRLIDSVTGGVPAVRGLKLTLGLLDELGQTTTARPLPPMNGRGLLPKGGGYYAASELEPGHYVLTVQSPDYMPARLEWTIEPQSSIPFQVDLRLLPAPAYPYAQRFTRVYCRCIDEQGHPLAGIDLFLRGSQTAAARARLRREATAGTDELYVRATGAEPVIGEQMVLLCEPSSSDDPAIASASAEPIRIANSADDEPVAPVQTAGERCWKLAQPLQRDYPAGTSLLAVVQGRSDRRGEALLVLTSLPGGATDYELSTGADETLFRTHLTLKEGEALRVELNRASGQVRVRTM